ncbi:MAG: copper chaperone PCu(A)C [Anaerolineae bacterium]|nr:copper chaperone PCu(A)C [Anaerolineae bacterium]
MVKKHLWLLAALFILITVLAAQCGAARPDGLQIKVVEPWARSSPMVAGNGAVFMELINEGDTDDTLLGAETDLAAVVELHETTMEGDMMKMNPVSKIEVPAGGSVRLEPGGLHLMLINLRQELVPGEKVKLILNFEISEPLTIEAEIREMGAEMSH